MGRPIKYKRGRKCLHPRLGVVALGKWIGKNGFACELKLKDGGFSLIKTDNWHELKVIENKRSNNG